MSDFATPSAAVPQVYDTPPMEHIGAKVPQEPSGEIRFFLKREKIDAFGTASVSLEPKYIDFAKTTWKQRDHRSDEVAGETSGILPRAMREVTGIWMPGRNDLPPRDARPSEAHEAERLVGSQPHSAVACGRWHDACF